MSLAQCVVLRSEDASLLFKVCKYVMGPDYRNVEYWRSVCVDPELVIEYEQQDPETMFLIIYPNNPFTHKQLVDMVVERVHEAVSVVQQRTESPCEVTIITRKDDVRTETIYQEGTCMTTAHHKEGQQYYHTTTEFPPLLANVC